MVSPRVHRRDSLRYSSSPSLLALRYTFVASQGPCLPCRQPDASGCHCRLQLHSADGGGSGSSGHRNALCRCAWCALARTFAMIVMGGHCSGRSLAGPSLTAAHPNSGHAAFSPPTHPPTPAVWSTACHCFLNAALPSQPTRRTPVAHGPSAFAAVRVQGRRPARAACPRLLCRACGSRAC